MTLHNQPCQIEIYSFNSLWASQFLNLIDWLKLWIFLLVCSLMMQPHKKDYRQSVFKINSNYGLGSLYAFISMDFLPDRIKFIAGLFLQDVQEITESIDVWGRSFYLCCCVKFKFCCFAAAVSVMFWKESKVSQDHFGNSIVDGKHTLQWVRSNFTALFICWTVSIILTISLWSVYVGVRLVIWAASWMYHRFLFNCVYWIPIFKRYQCFQFRF